MTDIFSLEGRVAIVTGGAGQLGAEIVRGLEERGAHVAVFDIASDPFRVDVTDRSALEAAVAEVGTPHILVNAAALDSPPDAPPEEVGPVETYPEESFDRVMDVNVKGTFLTCQVIGARMAAEGRGTIVNVSSIYGMLSPVQELYDFRRAGGEEFYKPALQPHALPRDVLGTQWSARQHAHARGSRERAAAGVRRRVHGPDAARPHGRCARGRRPRCLSRVGCVVVRHGRQPRCRRRLERVVTQPFFRSIS
jgi:hypothetical protein